MPLFWLKNYEKCTLATAALANNVESALLEIYLVKRVKISEICCALFNIIQIWTYLSNYFYQPFKSLLEVLRKVIS